MIGFIRAFDFCNALKSQITHWCQILIRKTTSQLR